MGKYDLFNVDDYEFESVCDDLIGAKLHVDVKRGKRGPDGGRDGTFTFDGCKRGVVQVKHYAANAYAALLRELKEKELSKAEALQPDCYVLMTSCQLSFGNRDEIVAMFHGLLEDKNLFGGEDICTELAKPECTWVVRNHHNLWLKGIEQLEAFCGDGALAASTSYLETAKEDLAFAVQTESFSRAVLKLEADHVLIITGQAGTGKTTLAKQIVVDQVVNGHFKFVVSNVDLGVFERQLENHPDERFLFLCDDFFGENVLRALNNNESSRVVLLIRRIRRSPNCRFILTSRSYIIRDARREYVNLDDSRISEYEFELMDSKLTRIDRARILLSRLKAGDVSDAYKSGVYANENYFKIIDHKNFNPRIVSYCFDTRYVRQLGADAQAVMKEVFGLLDDPSQIWRDCLGVLTKVEFYLVIMVFLARECPEADLRSAFLSLRGRPECSQDASRPFGEVVKKLCCSVLNRKVEDSSTGSSATYSLVNPSVGDYIIGAYADEDVLFSDVALVLQNPAAIRQLGRNGSWLAHGIQSRYAKTCKKAYDHIFSALVENPKCCRADCVLRVFNDMSSWMLPSGRDKHVLAEVVLKAGVAFDPLIDVEQVVDFFTWVRREAPRLIPDVRLEEAFLERICGALEDGKRFVELKGLYDMADVPVPDSYYDKLIEDRDHIVDDILSDRVFDRSDTEEELHNDVVRELRDLFEDCDMPCDRLSIEDCVDDYDFSPYVENDSDGSRYNDESIPKRLRAEEDAVIRRIFSQ